MGNDGNALITIDRSQAERAAETLSRAFQRYSMIQYVYPEEDKREVVCRYFFGTAVMYSVRYGIVNTVTPEFEGVAVWLPPEGFPMTFGKILRAVPLSVIIGFARSGAGRMRNIGDFLDGVHKKVAPFPHWCLEAIGIAPEYQGKGLGKKLIEFAEREAIRQGYPEIYLYTNEHMTNNISIYSHLGFIETERCLKNDRPAVYMRKSLVNI